MKNANKQLLMGTLLFTGILFFFFFFSSSPISFNIMRTLSLIGTPILLVITMVLMKSQQRMSGILFFLISLLVIIYTLLLYTLPFYAGEEESVYLKDILSRIFFMILLLPVFAMYFFISSYRKTLYTLCFPSMAITSILLILTISTIDGFTPWILFILIFSLPIAFVLLIIGLIVDIITYRKNKIQASEAANNTSPSSSITKKE